MGGKIIGSSLCLLLDARSFPGWTFDLSSIPMLRAHSVQWWQVRSNDTERAVGYLDGSVLWNGSLLPHPTKEAILLLCHFSNGSSCCSHKDKEEIILGAEELKEK